MNPHVLPSAAKVPSVRPRQLPEPLQQVSVVATHSALLGRGLPGSAGVCRAVSCGQFSLTLSWRGPSIRVELHVVIRTPSPFRYLWHAVIQSQNERAREWNAGHETLHQNGLADLCPEIGNHTARCNQLQLALQRNSSTLVIEIHSDGRRDASPSHRNFPTCSDSDRSFRLKPIKSNWNTARLPFKIDSRY